MQGIALPFRLGSERLAAKLNRPGFDGQRHGTVGGVGPGCKRLLGATEVDYRAELASSPHEYCVRRYGSDSGCFGYCVQSAHGNDVLGKIGTVCRQHPVG